MGSSVSKYLEENVGHFGNNAKEIVMSDREIMNAKNPKKIQEFMDDEVNQTITIFKEEYPDLSNEFIKIQAEMYAMFAAKHMDYGLNNIALGGDIVNNSNDKQFSLTGLCIRLTDKISRLKNLLVNGRSFVKGEGMEDTFIDIANYGIIGLLVGRDKWKK
jgi:hypothetical protein|tara:strand:- start:462 stop:941 length:480 start_codon:yes stop_codon:yes gene_type:complete